MARLTADIRQRIATAAAAAAYKEEMDAVKQELGEIAERAYRNSYSEEQEEQMLLANRRQLNTMYMIFGDDNGSDRIGESIEMPSPRPAPYDTVVFHNTEARDQVVELRQRLVSLRQNYNLLRNKVIQITTLVTTTGRLREIWPAGLKFIPSEEELKAATNGPDLSFIAEVNGLLMDAGVDLEE